MFGQTGGSSAFGTVKTQTNISGAFSAGGGSVQAAGFGGLHKPEQPVIGQSGILEIDFESGGILPIQKLRKVHLGSSLR